MRIKPCEGLNARCPVPEKALFTVTWRPPGQETRRARLGTVCATNLRSQRAVVEIEVARFRDACQGSLEELCPENNTATFTVSWRQPDRRRKVKARLCEPCVRALRAHPMRTDIQTRVWIPRGGRHSD